MMYEREKKETQAEEAFEGALDEVEGIIGTLKEALTKVEEAVARAEGLRIISHDVVIRADVDEAREALAAAIESIESALKDMMFEGPGLFAA